jgi:hypothetical protein
MLELPNTKGLSNLISEGLNFENVIHTNSNSIGEKNYELSDAIESVESRQ